MQKTDPLYISINLMYIQFLVFYKSNISVHDHIPKQPSSIIDYNFKWHNTWIGYNKDNVWEIVDCVYMCCVSVKHKVDTLWLMCM